MVDNADTVRVKDVLLDTDTLDTVIVDPPLAVAVAAGEPADAKFVPVTTIEVAPVAIFVELVAVTVGMGRMVATVTAVPLDTPYIDTVARSV